MRKQKRLFPLVLAICTALNTFPAGHYYLTKDNSFNHIYEVNGEETSNADIDSVDSSTITEITTTPETSSTYVPEETTEQPTKPSQPTKINLRSSKVRISTSHIRWVRSSVATGYQVWVRCNKDKKAKLLKITKNNYYPISKLKKGYFYRIKVRTYKRSNGKIYYSRFSNTVKLLTPFELSSVSSNIAGNLSVQWNQARVGGYILQYSTDKSFANYAEVKLKGMDNTSAVFYELKQGTKYYVRIRGYRTVGTTKYYSRWSKTKSVKIKDSSDIINGGFPDTNGFYKDSVFFGDSVMLGFSNYVNRKPKGYLDGARVFGIGSYSLIHAVNPSSPLHPLYRGKHLSPEYLAKEMGAKKIFLFFGINDVCTGSGLEGAYTNYKTLIDNITNVNPDAEIYIIGATYTLKGSKLYQQFHDRLHSLNDKMRSYCSKHGYQFIDIASYLSDNDGYLKPEYCSDGFLHETYSAYEIWDKVLRNFACEM